MIKTGLYVAFIVMGLATFGCKKGASSGSASDGGGDPNGGTTVTIAEAGLTFQLPPKTDVGEVTALMGTYTYPCCGGAAIQIEPVKPDSVTAPKTFDEAKKGVEIFKNVKVTKSSTTADGWRIEFDHDTGMGHSYKIDVRRSWGGNSYDCEVDAPDAAKAQIAVKGCETLAPVGGAKTVAAGSAPAGSGGAAPTAAPTGATAGGGSSCPKAVACCRVLSGDKSPSCDPLANSPEQTCATSLVSFRKAVKATKPKRVSECD